jgi:putative oxidoreductase
VTFARVAAGVVFVVFGVGKFTQHAREVDSFRTYGLPAPDAFVTAIGVLEIVGGLMLIAGVLVPYAALALAGDMVGAIVVSGIKEGEPISLTLAPALLLVMLLLLRDERKRVPRPRRAANRGRRAHSGRVRRGRRP